MSKKQTNAAARDAALQKGSQVLAGAAVTNAAAAAATAAGISATAAGVAPATAAVAGMLSAAGVVSTVPIAGWIAAGGLATAAAITALIYKFTNAGRKAAMAFAESLGAGGLAFAREYANNADKSTEKIQRRMMHLAGRIAFKQARTGSFLASFREERTSELIDRYNADMMILGIRQAQAQAPAVAGETATAGIVATEAVDWVPWAVGGTVALTALAAAAHVIRKRRG